nr:MAG TPA: hypothetical protein [Bacteriophage sp.]
MFSVIICYFYSHLKNKIISRKIEFYVSITN